MFEINLIKDRVVPRTLGLKRLVIVGSFVGLMLVITLFIGFFGMQVGFRVDNTSQSIERVRAQLEDYRPDHQAVIEAKRTRDEAAERTEHLFTLWDGPIHFGAVFRYHVIGLKNHEELNDKISVIYAEFEAGTNDNEVRIVAVTNDHNAARTDPERENTVANLARSLADGPGAVSRIRYVNVRELPNFVDPFDSNIRDEPPSRGGLLRLEYAPLNPLVFSYEDDETEN